MVYEPTAAAVYHVFSSLKGNRKIPSVILVFDFGGGTLDLSIIDTSLGTFKVKAIHGDYFLGG